MVKITREYLTIDRSYFDNGICSSENGFAQVDTRNDAGYHGIWANPSTFIVFTYIEGEWITVQCETKEEFVQEMMDLKSCHKEDFKGIDPGYNNELKQRFIEIGLLELLY